MFVLFTRNAYGQAEYLRSNERNQLPLTDDWPDECRTTFHAAAKQLTLDEAFQFIRMTRSNDPELRITDAYVSHDSSAVREVIELREYWWRAREPYVVPCGTTLEHYISVDDVHLPLERTTRLFATRADALAHCPNSSSSGLSASVKPQTLGMAMRKKLSEIGDEDPGIPPPDDAQTFHAVLCGEPGTPNVRVTSDWRLHHNSPACAIAKFSWRPRHASQLCSLFNLRLQYRQCPRTVGTFIITRAPDASRQCFVPCDFRPTPERGPTSRAVIEAVHCGSRIFLQDMPHDFIVLWAGYGVVVCIPATWYRNLETREPDDITDAVMTVPLSHVYYAENAGEPPATVADRRCISLE